MGTLDKKIGLFLLGGGGDGDDSDFREERGGIVEAKVIKAEFGLWREM